MRIVNNGRSKGGSVFGNKLFKFSRIFILANRVDSFQSDGQGVFQTPQGSRFELIVKRIDEEFVMSNAEKADGKLRVGECY